MLARTGAVFYALWGLLHVVGGGMILASAIDGPAAGYAHYLQSEGSFPPLAGAILAMNSFTIACIGAIVLWVAITGNWRNSRAAAWLNLALAGMLDLGMILYLLRPGFVAASDASLGIGLFVAAAAFSLLALRGAGGGRRPAG